MLVFLCDEIKKKCCKLYSQYFIQFSFVLRICVYYGSFFSFNRAVIWNSQNSVGIRRNHHNCKNIGNMAPTNLANHEVKFEDWEILLGIDHVNKGCRYARGGDELGREESKKGGRTQPTEKCCFALDSEISGPDTVGRDEDIQMTRSVCLFYPCYKWQATEFQPNHRSAALA